MRASKLLSKAIDFEDVDRIAIVPLIFAHSAIISNVPICDYLRDGKLLAECQIKAFQKYGHDAIFAIMDAFVETEALGSILEFRKDHYPIIKKYALSNPSELENLSLPVPYKTKRMPEVLKAIRILRKKYNDEVFIIGCVLGPMSLAMQLFGPEKTLFLSIDDPEKFSQILEFSKKVSIEFGKAQIEAGIHLLVLFEPSSSPAVVPHQFFREFILQHIKEIFSCFKKAGVLANCLHIPGHTGSILQYYPKLGIDIANFDYYIDPIEVKRKLPDICFLGNIKSLSFVDSRPEDIKSEALKLINIFNHKGGFILSSGSEIPPFSKPENIKEIIRVAKSCKKF